MSSDDNIEGIMRRRMAEEHERKGAAAQTLAAKIAVGAEAAREYIALMRKHKVAPETIYRHTQVRIHKNKLFGYRPDTCIERFVPVDKGWVVHYCMTEYNSPWLIKYLRPDGLLKDCDARGPSREYPNEGLVKAPARTALGSCILCVTILDEDPSPPYFTKSEYADAARWYLS